ncbi:hypothetical protein B0T39_20250 [Chromobacterium haemolyticum]|nr:hypothetical protein B0T39_20250 [Chromobacterium haemolyticum]
MAAPVPLPNQGSASRIPLRYVAQRLVNAQASQAQRLILYLDRLSHDLKWFRRSASLLANDRANAAVLRQPAEAVRRCWAQRLPLTAAGLDDGLHWCGAGAARCRFVLQGAQHALLPAERLSFRCGQRQSFLNLRAEMDGVEQARAWDRALAVFGLLVEQDADGRLLLSMRELDAPALLGRLTVTGEDGLFPARGQTELPLQPLPAVISPEDWTRPSRLASSQAQATEALQRVARVKAEVRMRQADIVTLLDQHLLGGDGQGVEGARQALAQAFAAEDYFGMQALLTAVGRVPPALADIMRAY